MGFSEAVKTCFRKYVDFEGRASRSEFWYFQLFYILVTVALWAVVLTIMATMGESAGRVVGVILLLAMFVFIMGTLLPHLAVSVRRLHDTGKSGLWLLIAFVPAGGIVLLVFYCIGGDPGANRFGPDPYNQDRITRTFE